MFCDKLDLDVLDRVLELGEVVHGRDGDFWTLDTILGSKALNILDYFYFYSQRLGDSRRLRDMETLRDLETLGAWETRYSVTRRLLGTWRLSETGRLGTR